MQAAFFDLDKTVIARSSTLAFGRPFMREGLISRGQVLKGIYAQLVYQLIGADEDKMEKLRVALLELTRGWEKTKIEALVRETINEIIEPVIFEEALALIAEHRAAGRRVYIVSSSGEEIVRPLAEHLGVPHFIATRAKVGPDGCYTGELDFYCYGEHKAVAIREQADKYGIDLSESYAYSDSVTDLPMLEVVGHPHVVNPDRELRGVSAERGWVVLEFRHPITLRSRLAASVPRPSPTAAVVLAAVIGAGVAWAAFRRFGEPAA